MDFTHLDQLIQVLEAHADEWARLPIPQKINLLAAVRHNLDQAASQWVEVAVAAKGIDPSSPWVGEEWVTGPWALAMNINALLKTLIALAASHPPTLPQVTSRKDGRVVARVFPDNLFERLLLSDVTAEVWMQPGVTVETLPDHMASFYKRPMPSGHVALVLGAGNVNSIAPLDALYKLFTEGQVVLLKLNPVNDYLGPILKTVFAPLIDGGYLRLASGGADVGEYLTRHASISSIHITGSARTHDLIVYGAGADGAARKRREEPILTKPITSELGGVGPTIVVPGPWSAADIRYQAENIVTMKLHNGGCNCVASQVLILPEAWDQSADLLAAVRTLLDRLPPRAPYYPGAVQRQQEALTRHPNAEQLGPREAPRVLITNLDPAATDEYCFTEEVFGPVYAQTSLPCKTPAEFLRRAVSFCNDTLRGTLGVTILIHPRTLAELGAEFEQAVADLRYGSIGINVWNALAFLLPQASWGAYPGHTFADIQSGIGCVHNSFMFDRPQKTVVRGSFYPFPRAWLHGEWHIAPKPLWFVTNKTAHITARRATQYAMEARLRHLPGVFAAALFG
ncbi:MAG TPA: aldehyde dehydrogenase family protein [Verrucomicrobiae bacterium]|nr:aldehyde dehydrogenase family protein [Verrucomicrobiae bacterium]